jgi:hypothetical protein
MSRGFTLPNFTKNVISIVVVSAVKKTIVFVYFVFSVG